MKSLRLALMLGLLAAPAAAQQPSVMGTWLTASGVAQVRIGACPNAANGPICGFVVGLINPRPDGKVVAPDVAVDHRNPDPALRGRKVIGMPLIWGFKRRRIPMRSRTARYTTARTARSTMPTSACSPMASSGCVASSGRRCSERRRSGPA